MSLRKARSFRLVVQTVEADQSFMPVALTATCVNDSVRDLTRG